MSNYILHNGLTKSVKPDGFYIDERVIGCNWSLLESEVAFDNKFHELMDLIPLRYFEDSKHYHRVIDLTHPNVLHAGISPESALSRDQFSEYLRNIKDADSLRLLYTEDTRDRLNFLCNSVSDIKALTGSFYSAFNKVAECDAWLVQEHDSVRFLSGPVCDTTFAILECIIQKFQSSLDLSVKLAYCLLFTPDYLTSYSKMGSENKLWSNRNKIANEVDFSSLENFKYARELESLRNEFAHNGSWEACRRVYAEVRGGEVVNQWICFNDHIDGRAARVHNRSRFYSGANGEIHINEILPLVIESFLLAMAEFLGALIDGARKRIVK